MRASKESDDTHAAYRVAAFQTFLSGRISTFGDKRLKLLVEAEDGRLSKARNPYQETVDALAEAFPGEWIDRLPDDQKPEKFRDDNAVNVLQFKRDEEVA